MGLEAECTVRVGRKTSAGKALLESERLLFRGDPRLDIPFDEMRDVTVDGETLVVKTNEQELRFELAAGVADRWLRLIKEPKGLFEKLEVTPQSRVAVVDISDSVFLAALRERVAGIVERRVPQGAEIIFFGAETREALRRIPLIRARMADAGVLWIVRPKGSRGISEADVFEALRTSALTDTKVVAFSKTHTAHKCMIPLELRGKAIPRPRIVSIPPGAPSGGSAGGAKPKAKTSRPPSARPAVRSNGKKADGDKRGR